MLENRTKTTSLYQKTDLTAQVTKQQLALG